MHNQGSTDLFSSYQSILSQKKRAQTTKSAVIMAEKMAISPQLGRYGENNC